MRVPLPKPVACTYRADSELENQYGTLKRKFTPDGHLVGSICEVIAAESLGLSLYPSSHKGHDAHDGKGGDVQITITARKKVAMYAAASRLVVLQLISPEEAEIVYDGPGEPA